MRKAWLELPLALFSFGFYKLNKFVIGLLYRVYLQVNRTNAQQWRTISAESLEKFLSLPVLMTKAPRWNTHAIIGTLGPLPIQESLTLDMVTIRQSAGSWVGCIYAFPSYRTCCNFTPLTDNPEQTQLTIPLPPGRYTVGLRYYHPKVDPAFPQITTDRGLTVPLLSVSPDNNAFYHQLAEKTNLYFWLLHYYLFTLFQLRQYFPEGFVKREFLPVGATDTRFFFGAIAPHQSLQVAIAPELCQDFDLYFTQYNRASFPLTWQQLTADYNSEAIAKPSYYLIRMRPRSQDTAQRLKNITSTEVTISKSQKKLMIH